MCNCAIRLAASVIMITICSGTTENSIEIDNVVTAKENSSITLNCTMPSNISNSTCTWWNVAKDAWLIGYISEPDCKVHRNSFPDKIEFNCTHTNDEKIFSMTIKQVHRFNHTTKWKCSVVAQKNNLEIEHKVSILYVQVPVESVQMKSHKEEKIQIKENKSTTFECNTTSSRPVPAIFWFLSSQDLQNTMNVTNEARQSPQAGDSINFTAATGVLNYTFSRRFNGWSLYCQAANMPVQYVTSGRKLLDVMYPPDDQPKLINTETGSTYRIVEHRLGRLSCIINGGNPLPNLTWLCFDGNVSKTTGNTSVSTTFTWKALRIQHNSSCTCVSEHIFGKSNVSTVVKVLYPPDIPTIKVESNSIDGIIEITENKSLNLTCTSKSNPESDYTWIRETRTEVTFVEIGQSMQSNRVQETDTGEYVCMVNNTMVGSDGLTQEGKSNSSITIHILFPPRIPTFSYIGIKTYSPINDTSIDVIKGDNFTLLCQSDGRPTPDYTWETASGGNTSVIVARQSVNKTCTATNNMTETFGESRRGSALATISVTVLYTPTTPQMYMYSHTGKKHNIHKYVSVIENYSFNLTCISDGRPSPQYKWYVNNSEISPQQELVKMFIRRQQKGIYKCQASNIMIRTFGERQHGTSNANTTLDVLYPAEVGDMTDTIAIEGSSINMTCPIIPGNPSATTVNWEPRGNLGGFTSHVLYISNISRKDEDIYVCSVTTRMKTTHGPSEEQVNYGQFQLTVVYKALVTKFYIGTETDKNIYTVNEKEDVTFLCYIDSKPSPNATIHKNAEIVHVSGNNNLVYTIKNIQCTDFGLYICSGINYFNDGTPSEKSLTLHINCSPRPSPFVELNTAVKSARNMPATLSFTAIAYPEPGFSWNYMKGSDLISLSNNSNVVIASSNVQSNITIKSVTQADYGLYILRIENDIAVYEQKFVIEPYEQVKNPSELENSSKTGVIAGTVSGVSIFIVVSIVVGIFLFRKRTDDDTGKLIYQNVPFTGNKLKRKKNEKGKACDTPMEDLQEIDDAPALTQEPTEYYNSADRLEMIDRIKVSELFSYLLANDEDSFGIAYQKLPTGLEKPCTFARKPENLALNRYNGIYPYDHSRVKLQDHPDFFINACYIDGYQRPKSYIASLGPTGKTTRGFKTFWQMIWHEKSDIIVMLTNLREPSGMKCERYWPEEGASELYGDVCVSSQKTDAFAEYTVRTLTMLKDEDCRTVTHLHYTAWPDKKVPEDATSLLEFRQRMKSTPTYLDGPIIVHCSAGIGRTGTLIALDRLIEQGNCEGSVNVFACVNSMREQRVKMVQTLEQYIYIYKALVNAFGFDSETTSVESFQEYVDTTNNNVYSRQFQQLKQSLEIEGKEDVEASTGNERITKKNRIEADIPARRFCVLLYTNEAEEESEYINAVYMNSFRIKEYFIIAQSPLPNNVTDFICMMYQEDCTCIVTMEDLTEPGMTVGVYLPSEKQTLNFGNFTVSSTILDTKHHCIVRKVKLKKNGKGEKSLYHFQYTKWMPGHDTPVNAREFVQFVIEVEEYARQFCEERSHVLVHCLKANERSGLFCAVTTLMEKLKYERQVNVLNTLRHLRTRRRSAITSMEQLKFCYHAASVYIKMYKP